jgi:hypothetical protein
MQNSLSREQLYLKKLGNRKSPRTNNASPRYLNYESRFHSVNVSKESLNSQGSKKLPLISVSPVKKRRLANLTPDIKRLTMKIRTSSKTLHHQQLQGSRPALETV